MQVQPAKLDQVQRARDGRMVLIPADVGGVAEDLRRIDPHLKLRWAESGNPPFFAVYWESDDKRDTHLVLTAKECDQRIVKRVQQIDSHGRGGYDYAAEVQRQNEQAEANKRKRARERVAEHGEELAHAIRRDLGWRYKHRTFVPADVRKERA